MVLHGIRVQADLNGDDPFVTAPSSPDRQGQEIGHPGGKSNSFMTKLQKGAAASNSGELPSGETTSDDSSPSVVWMKERTPRLRMLLPFPEDSPDVPKPLRLSSGQLGKFPLLHFALHCKFFPRSAIKYLLLTTPLKLQSQPKSFAATSSSTSTTSQPTIPP